MYVKCLLVAVCFLAASCTGCKNLRNFKSGVACVCDLNYCDKIEDLKIKELSGKNYQLYYTSSSKLGMDMMEGTFEENVDNRNSHIKLMRDKTYQTIYGWGGAFTDSVGIAISSLPTKLQDDLMESYFGKTGSEYSLCRVPMGPSDFSPYLYHYDEVPGDAKLEHFALHEQDLKNKIPFIQKAQKLRGNQPLKLFATPWTAPPWMKTVEGYTGPGVLRNDYYQTWANFAIRFFEEYKKHNISFWGMTIANEPYLIGFETPVSEVPAMGWTIYKFNHYLANHLGPTIRNSSFKDIKIMIHDDSRNSLHLVERQLGDDASLKYIDGVAMHWYEDGAYSAKFLQYAKTPKKDTFILYTESCFLGGPTIGNWTKAELYIKDIMQDLRNNVTGWVDWNMVLDTKGGPTYTLNNLDSPIIVNATAKEFYKQPMYYALAHFAKFITPGSVRIHSEKVLKNVHVEMNAFTRPDGLTLLLIYNSGMSLAVINVEGPDGKMTTIEVQGKSINSMIWK